MKKNTVSKKIAILIILIVFVSIMPITRVLGASHTLLRNSSGSLGSLLEEVPQGTTTSAEYAFSLKSTYESKIDFWGYEGTAVETDTDTYRAKMILPTDSSLSGKIGCTITNCGNYKGTNVNLKCTFIWEKVEVGGKEIYPVIRPAVNYKSGKIGFYFKTLAYGVTFELIDDDGNPIIANMSMSLGDIDAFQYIGFKEDSGVINKIQCRTDCNAVYYRAYNGYHFFYANDTLSDNGLESAVRLELKDTSKFTIWFGCEYDNYSMSGLTRYNKSVTDSALESYLKAAENVISTGSYSGISTGWGYMDGTAFGPYEVSKPTKYVSDSNELKVITNTLISDGEEVYYDIYQYVPSESTSYYYTSFKIEDKLPECLSYVSAKVYDNTGVDVTSNFTIETSGNTITATSKNTSVSDFYNNTYNIRINAKFNKSVVDNANSGGNWSYVSKDDAVEIINKATVTVGRGTDTVSETSDEVKSYFYYTTISGTKNWVDNNNALGLRPENYTVKLYSDGTYLKQTEFTDTNWSFEKLPKYDSTTGKEILYTISEDEILLSNGDKYLPSISGTTITNTLTGTVNIDLTKVWEDGNNPNDTRPNSILAVIRAIFVD